MNELNAFLISPLFEGVLLTKSLVLFTFFLLSIRFLPDFSRKLILLMVSLILIDIATSPVYLTALIFFAGTLYYLLFWLQWNPRKRRYSFILSAAIGIFYFLLLDLPALSSPWTGPMVHRFGVAYSLFRFLQVTLDVGRGEPLPADPLDYFIHVFFVPTFFQGPIERLGEFRNNLTDRPPLSWGETGSSLIRIGTAFIKGWATLKFFELDWKAYFDYPQASSYAFLLWGMYARAIGFYLFVSAANDLTIACCAIAGYRIHENYDYPYFRRNLALFWRSWHMTLVRFIRDYIYIPLGGNRRHVYLNYLIIFFAIAMWHVTSKAFIIWGLWHGVGMCALRAWQNFWKKVEARNPSDPFRSCQLWARRHPSTIRIVSTIFTFHYVALGWLPFWGGHPQGLGMIVRILTGNHWKLFEWSP